ncbi:MAG: IclR family transcriptional regulator [Deltaproteobacteria bacterium]|nr:IclR family transcriptional regulator [Deltaproteobacteria bacterium]
MHCGQLSDERALLKKVKIGVEYFFFLTVWPQLVIFYCKTMADNIIQSVNRALQILNLFSLNNPQLGITQISRELSLHKGTVQGLVRTLTNAGFLRQNGATRRYQLGLKIYELGVILAGGLEINQKASAPAHKLARQTQHLVRIAIQDGDSALVTLDAYPTPQRFLTWQFGPRSPLYCTALGKTLLAYLSRQEVEGYLKRVKLIPYTPHTITKKDKFLRELEETRKRGYAINREENLLTRAAIGVPIFGGGKCPVASMCLVGNPRYILGEDKENLAEKVMKTALEISLLMGHSQGVTYGEKR